MERLQKIMPRGSSTTSKAARYAPDEPGVIFKGKGCRVWDADGREYIDFRNSLGPITLGYCFPKVDQAIKSQLEKGIIFGHPTTLECQVAELFCDLVPCAEQARFMKTGGEAIAACIRIARAYTAKNHVIQIGYNGWVNSLAFQGISLPHQKNVSSPRGVPQGISDYYHHCIWNDIDALEEWFDKYDGDIAALVVSADYETMEAGKTFYPAIRDLTQKHNSLLIYDEIVTGFRVAVGGVQEYFNVTPDLAVFAKGIANGMPLSVYAGRKEIMKTCDRDGIVISITHGGEALSLAAAKAVMEVYQENDVVSHLWKQGEKLWTGLNALFQKHDVPMRLKGLWPCPLIALDSDSSENLLENFYRAAYRHGVSLYGIPYINYSHRDKDIAETLERLEQAVAEL